MDLTLMELLMYATVRIECTTKNNHITAGTGYLFEFKQNEETNTHTPVLITSKQVIRDAEKGKLIFTRENMDGDPDDKKHYKVSLSKFEEKWTMHPDADVDLCALPIESYLLKARAKGQELFYAPLEISMIPTEEEINDLNAMEEIVTVGYPDGLWDSINNKAVFRKGVTATRPKLDYNGKKEFMIDTACIPGTSGSPVVIVNENGYFDRNGNSYPDGMRLLFLGTLSAAPQVTTDAVDVPSPRGASSYGPSNFGLVIKSSRILELEELF